MASQAALPCSQLRFPDAGLDDAAGCCHYDEAGYAEEDEGLLAACPADAGPSAATTQSEGASCDNADDLLLPGSQGFLVPSQDYSGLKQGLSQHAELHAHTLSRSFMAGEKLQGQVLGGRFQLGARIGQGSFGCCYAALDLQTRAQVVVKVSQGKQLPSCEVECHFCDFLRAELVAYERLGGRRPASGTTAIPRVHAAGMQKFCAVVDPQQAHPNQPCVVFSWLAMQRLGPNVWAAVQQLTLEAALSDSEDGAAQQHCSWPDRAWIHTTARGMLKALADVHSRGIIHRDVKTENFTLGADDGNGSIYLIDYGFARHAFGHYSFRSAYETPGVASFWGTPDYASIASLRQLPQMPRDDLEALVYCLVELEQPSGRLPWHSQLTCNSEAAKGWSDEQLRKMADKKHRAWRSACKKGLVAPHLQSMHTYLISLKPRELPDYEWLLAQVDSSLTGVAPAWQPRRPTYDGWPGPVDCYDRWTVAARLTQQAAAAAATILPANAGRATPAAAGPSAQRGPARKRSHRDAACEGQHWPQAAQQHGQQRHPQQQLAAAAAAGAARGHAQAGLRLEGEAARQLPEPLQAGKRQRLGDAECEAGLGWADGWPTLSDGTECNTEE